MALPTGLIAISSVGTAYFMNIVARLKSANPSNHPKEDEILGVDDKAKEENKARLEAQGGPDRWTRIAENQGENFPLHFFVLLAALVVGGKKEHVAYCFATYIVSRILFMLCYIFALSPWRSIAFILGQFSVVAAIVVGVLGVQAQAEDAEPPTTLFRFAGLGVTALFFVMNFVANLNAMDPNNHPAEDSALGVTEEEKGKYKQLQQEKGVNRWQRIALNQAESLPYAAAVLWGAYGVGADPTQLVGTFSVYAAFRVLFVLCYLCSAQPWRSLSWMFSNFTVITTAVLGIKACVGEPPLLCAMGSTFALWFLNVLAVFKALDPTKHPAEDSALGVDDKAKEEFKARVEAQGGVDRWTRVAVNQGENIPMALVVLWAAAAVGGDVEKVGYCFVSYAVCRFLFMVCYIFALSPWRSFAFMGSQITIVTAIVFGVNGALDPAVDGGLPLSTLGGAD